MYDVNVLIVDDEQAILNSFKAYYREYYNIFTAISAADAMPILAKVNIHVIVSDFNMPQKDGVVFFKEVSMLYPRISRIISTAYSEIHIATAAINVGNVHRYINKPWELHTLKQFIDECYQIHLQQL
jgi:response regulator RpfG family c-di-GMP phosphodiesterase